MAIKRNKRRGRDDDDRRGGGFVYKRRDPNKLREHAKQTGGSFDSIFKQGYDIYRPSGGTNQVRILPPTWKDPDHYGLSIWVHSYVGPDNSTYLCPEKMLNKKCPICAAAREAKDAGEDKEAKDLKAVQRYLVYVIERKGEVEGPQIWSMSWTQDRDIAVLAEDERSGKMLEVDHPEKGFDIIFKRKGEGKKTEYYGYRLAREETPISESKKEQRSILEQITDKPLDEALQFYDVKRLRQVIEGTAETEDDDIDDDDDDEDDDERRSKKRGGKNKSKSDDYDEDDADGEDDEDEDDDPRRRKRKSRKDDDDDEDDSDDDDSEDDEDEDDEEPRRRKRKSRKDDDDDEDDSDDDDDDEDDDPPRRRKRRR